MKLLKLLIGLFALVGFSQAWAVPCGDDTSGVFTLNSVTDPGVGDPTDAVYTNCEDGGQGNDGWPNDLTVFGMTYEALQKQNTPGALETETDINLVVDPTGGTISGSWSFTNLAAYSEYVILLNDGGSPQWSIYLLDSTKFGGDGTTWAGDWVYGQGKQLSHLSVYGKLAENVPAPAILGIMGIGLIGMVFSSGLRRRKVS